MMDFPFDILDHIFTFVKSHPESLIACANAHPVLSRIVERHRYYHTIIHTGLTAFNYSFKPSYLIKLLSETPRIVNHVRVLQIEFYDHQDRNRMAPYLEQIASILPMFPALECIILRAPIPWRLSWQQDLPQTFRTAIEDCFHLPTLQEIHIGIRHFPLSMLNNHAHIDHFSLSGSPKIPECLDTPYLQLKSLSVERIETRHSVLFSTWAKRHIVKLRSLKYDFSNAQIIAELLNICSDTLSNLHLSLRLHTSRESVIYEFGTVASEAYSILPINLSSLPQLRHLTIRADVYLESHPFCISFLPIAVEILKTAASLQQLTLEIHVIDLRGVKSLDKVYFSPLAALAESSASFHQIDLYFFSYWSHLTYTEIVSLLADYRGLVELIEQGVLVIHPEETAPTFLDWCSIASPHGI